MSKTIGQYGPFAVRRAARRGRTGGLRYEIIDERTNAPARYSDVWLDLPSAIRQAQALHRASLAESA